MKERKMIVIDFRLKTEIEKEAQKQQDRINEIQKKLDEEIEKLIKQYKLTSFELLCILNNLSSKEIGTRLSNFVAAKSQQNLAIQDKILKN